MKKLAIIDVDGTITDFYKIDHYVISTIYKNKIVLFLDKLLWMINSMDIISNNYCIFRLRIFLYSILSFKSYTKCITKYKELYVKEAYKYFKKFMENYYIVLIKNDYDVLILTADPFDCYVDNHVIVSQNKKQYILENALPKYDEIYIIGNNYTDDISAGLNLRKRGIEGCKYEIYYVGNSKILMNFLNNKNVIFCHSLKSAIKMLCKKT